MRSGETARAGGLGDLVVEDLLEFPAGRTIRARSAGSRLRISLAPMKPSSRRWVWNSASASTISRTRSTLSRPSARAADPPVQIVHGEVEDAHRHFRHIGALDRAIIGGHCEVFFEDLFVPDDAVRGAARRAAAH